MNAMKIYKITLSPQDWFFFGGSSTFDNGVKSSYIAHSDKFPQQTALLGLMRYIVLKNENLLITGQSAPDLSNKRDEVIGDMSFAMGKADQQFGQIMGLSPVFLERKSDSRCFFPIPLSHGYQMSLGQADVYMNGEKKEFMIDSASFVEKDYCNYLYYSSEDGEKISVSEIFRSQMQIGITKNTDIEKKEDEKEKGFYKHEMVRFQNDDFCFAFFVEMADEAKTLKNDYVFLGAERSCFKMEVQEMKDASNLTQCFLKMHYSKAEEGRIELLSPTYVENVKELNELCDFQWCYRFPFRNLTFAKEGNGRLNSGKISYHRGNVSYNMLCAGSVLFFQEKNRERIEALLNDVHMQVIGYNYHNSMNNHKTE